MKKFFLKSTIILAFANICFISCQESNLEDISNPQNEEVSLKLKAEQSVLLQQEEVEAFGKAFNNQGARNATTSNETIVQIASKNPNFKSLVAAAVKTGLASTLSSTSINVTVFAPTDAAFAQLPAPFNNPSNIASITKPDEIATLRAILSYHVLGAEVKRADIALGKSSATTLKPAGPFVDNVVYISNQNRLLFLNGNTLIQVTDIDASNGVIHVINKVLQFPTQNVAQIAIANPRLSSLVATLVKTDLAGVFTGSGNFTVFAPTNAAFAHLPAPFNNAANINAITDKTQIDALSNILRLHVLDNRTFSFDLGVLQPFTTLANAPDNKIVGIFGVNSGVVKGDGNRTFSTITPANILATNGVIHVINQVLLPK
jgi:uncharacterized surface protein with fasciclin (FAS1) repeats